MPPHGRREITVGDEFASPANIGYIIFESDSDVVEGYTKFYIEGQHRVAIPAVKELNTGDIYISHIASIASDGVLQPWYTGVSLLNTTSLPKTLSIEFDNGQTKTVSLAAKEHRAFLIRQLFGGQPQPGILSAVIKDGSGVIGLELFAWGSNQLTGNLLKDDTASKMYYPHIPSTDGWFTGVVAYNPLGTVCDITITPYTVSGAPLTPVIDTITGKGKYIGVVSALGLPANAAWFQIDATNPITGFELFVYGSNQMAGYTSVGIKGKEGVFAKIDKSGYTGIAFVNTGNTTASILLTAYDDNGNTIATKTIGLAGHEKVVNMAPSLFSQGISDATYIAYSSDLDVVGFQLNVSTDAMMLDALPGM